MRSLLLVVYAVMLLLLLALLVYCHCPLLLSGIDSC